MLPLLSGLSFQVGFLAFGAICAFAIAWLVIFILIAIWVYRDAESRGMGGALWLIIVILLGIIGLIVYLIVRGSHPVGGTAAPYAAYPPQYPPPAYPPQQPPAAPAGAATCKNCGSPLNPGAAFCPRCGAKV